MTRIKLPEEKLEKESFKSLPAKDKEEYVSNLLKKVLDINPEGVTISTLKEATGLTASTIWHHLEILKSSSQIRKISHGNMDVYYPFGEMEYIADFDDGNVRYSLSNVNNVEGKFLCIHEKRENRLGSYSILRGVGLPFNLLDDFAAAFKNAKKSMKK